MELTGRKTQQGQRKPKGQRKAPAQIRIRTYNRKIEIIPKDKIIQFRVTTAQETALKQILQQRGMTIVEYFTKIIDNEIQKDMNKHQIAIFETADLK